MYLTAVNRKKKKKTPDARLLALAWSREGCSTKNLSTVESSVVSFASTVGGNPSHIFNVVLAPLSAGDGIDRSCDELERADVHTTQLLKR